jgi:sulfite reductase alpha subunit-like flavoprotein
LKSVHVAVDSVKELR